MVLHAPVTLHEFQLCQPAELLYMPLDSATGVDITWRLDIVMLFDIDIDIDIMLLGIVIILLDIILDILPPVVSLLPMTEPMMIAS